MNTTLLHIVYYSTVQFILHYCKLLPTLLYTVQCSLQYCTLNCTVNSTVLYRAHYILLYSAHYSTVHCTLQYCTVDTTLLYSAHTYEHYNGQPSPSAITNASTTSPIAIHSHCHILPSKATAILPSTATATATLPISSFSLVKWTTFLHCAVLPQLLPELSS